MKLTAFWWVLIYNFVYTFLILHFFFKNSRKIAFSSSGPFFQYLLFSLSNVNNFFIYEPIFMVKISLERGKKGKKMLGLLFFQIFILLVKNSNVWKFWLKITSSAPLKKKKKKKICSQHFFDTVVYFLETKFHNHSTKNEGVIQILIFSLFFYFFLLKLKFIIPSLWSFFFFWVSPYKYA